MFTMAQPPQLQNHSYTYDYTCQCTFEIVLNMYDVFECTILLITLPYKETLEVHL